MFVFTIGGAPTLRSLIVNVRDGDIRLCRYLDSKGHSRQAASIGPFQWLKVLVLVLGVEKIRCTPRHRFFTGGWRAAKDLGSGDVVLCLDGHCEKLLTVRAGLTEEFPFLVTQVLALFITTGRKCGLARASMSARPPFALRSIEKGGTVSAPGSRLSSRLTWRMFSITNGNAEERFSDASCFAG
jgi:hypothetical protein